MGKRLIEPYEFEPYRGLGVDAKCLYEINEALKQICTEGSGGMHIPKTEKTVEAMTTPCPAYGGKGKRQTWCGGWTYGICNTCHGTGREKW